MLSIYFRPQVSRYVNLFVERSGSTYLASLLASHPDVLAKREEFAHLDQRGVDGKGQIAWAKDFWIPPLLGRHRAVGFKTKLVDVQDPSDFGRVLVDYGVRVIQLQRQNHVKAVVSTLNAKRLHDRSGNWNLLKESDRLPAFRVDRAEFERLLQERIRWNAELEEYVSGLGVPRIRLVYEDLLRDEGAFLQEIFKFIGVRPRLVKGRTLKNTSDDLRKVILNFDEIRNQYADTPYHRMFTEVISG